MCVQLQGTQSAKSAANLYPTMPHCNPYKKDNYAGESFQAPATVLYSYHYYFLLFIDFLTAKKKHLKTLHIKLSLHHHIDENTRLLVFNLTGTL